MRTTVVAVFLLGGCLNGLYPASADMLCSEIEWTLIGTESDDLNAQISQYAEKYPDGYSFGTMRCYESYYKQFDSARKELPAMQKDFTALENTYKSLLANWQSLAKACAADGMQGNADNALENSKNLEAWAQSTLYGPKGAHSNLTRLTEFVKGLDEFIVECEAERE